MGTPQQKLKLLYLDDEQYRHDKMRSKTIDLAAKRNAEFIEIQHDGRVL